MSEYRVVVTDNRYTAYEEEKKVLAEIGAEVEINDFADDGEAAEKLKDADGILLNLYPLSGEIISSLPKCRVISRYGAGFDNVDVDAATKAGIWVCRVPDYAYEDVSDHALGMILSCARMIPFKDRHIRSGEWNLHFKYKSYRLKDKVLGLVGYGGIARILHRKVGGLGLSRVLVFDPYVDDGTIEKAGGVPADLETLMKESDYVSVHAPLTDETKHIIGKKELGLMKGTAILVNTSRGPLIDQQALADVLAAKKIGAAGLDVFDSEPLEDSSPLKKLDNVVLTDHTGWYTEESMAELKTKAAQNIAEVLKGGKPLYPVNQV